MSGRKCLPNYAFLTPEAAERYAQATQKGIFNLLPSEVFWRDRQPFLEQHGYLLRPRYHSGWKPSWLGTTLDPTFCEDSIALNRPNVIDARRMKDGYLVAIKVISNDDQELEIAQFLSSLGNETQNHSVPLLDVLDDPFDNRKSLIVTPYLRPCMNPKFETIGDVTDFVEQTLEGLSFLHNHRIAHRDVAVQNIMMDGRPLYPDGHHPIRRNYSEDAIYELTPRHRSQHPVRYYFIDFGLSARFAEGSSTLVVGDVGRDAEVPELSSHIPYDGLKADIYALGNLYYKEFEQKYHNLEFLADLTGPMRQTSPEARPTADELLIVFKRIRTTLNESVYWRRISPKSEPAYERIINDTVAVARQSLYRLGRYVITG